MLGTREDGSRRRRIASLHGEMLKALDAYQSAAQTVPGRMMRDMLPFTDPYMELAAAGFGPPLDAMLQVKQFTDRMVVPQVKFKAGRAFTLAVELYNGGFCPWIPGDHHYLKIDPAPNALGLPRIWDFNGELVLPGGPVRGEPVGDRAERTGHGKDSLEVRVELGHAEVCGLEPYACGQGSSREMGRSWPLTDFCWSNAEAAG